MRGIASKSKVMKTEIVIILLLSIICCASVALSQPIPDIKGNKSADGPISLSQNDILSITINLDPGEETGKNADWFLAAATPYGLYFLTALGWTTDWLPAYQGPLFPINELALFRLPLSGFPTGMYTFFWGIDTHMDGSISWDSFHFDSLEIQVVPGYNIENLKGLNWEQYVGKIVTVEGIFVRDPLPTLVTDLDIVKANGAMPDEQYIVLNGNEAQEINPGKYGGAKLKLTGVVNKVDSSDLYKGEKVALRVVSYEFLERTSEYNPQIVNFMIQPEVRQPHSYAVLFSGGIKPTSNHLRYWNDLKFMYSTLINKYGYNPGNIAVLYADGKGRDKNMPVHYSATQSNLETVFNVLRGLTTQEDSIFLFTTNHGGGFLKNDPNKKYNIYGGQLDTNGDEAGDILLEKNYNLDINRDGDKADQFSWDECLYTWGDRIIDDVFRTMVANLVYDRMVIVMEQCFSGGLIADMAQGGNNRVIMSAAGEYEFSWAMGPSYNYDEFSYHFTSAINGKNPDGKIVNADTNKDGDVSMVEAFNYAKTKDSTSETPWYEDDGNGIPHSAFMPAGGDGTLGGNTTLEGN